MFQLKIDIDLNPGIVLKNHELVHVKHGKCIFVFRSVYPRIRTVYIYYSKLILICCNAESLKGHLDDTRVFRLITTGKKYSCKLTVELSDYEKAHRNL